MKTLTHRERVLISLSHEEPDRIPLDLGGASYNMTDPVYFEVKRELGLTGDISPYRTGRTSNYYDERVLEALDIDFRHIGLRERADFIPQVAPDGTFKDEWGCLYKNVGLEVAIIGHPLSSASEDELEIYPWPDPRAPGRAEGLTERAKYLCEHSDYAIVARPATSLGIFEWCCSLRGTEQFLMDLLINKSFAHHLASKVCSVLKGLYQVLLEAVGPTVHIVQYASDYGTQQGLFMSPQTYREMLKPYDREIIKAIKGLAPNAKVFFHSCGAVYPLIPDFIDIGVEILNPLQPLAAGMDSDRIKAEFGDKLSFHGAIDIQQALPGTEEDVEREVRTRIAILAPGGGYILAPANHIQPDTPGKNVVLLYQLAAKLGRYPIKV